MDRLCNIHMRGFCLPREEFNLLYTCERLKYYMVHGLTIVMKDFLPIMAKLSKEAATTKACPSLKMPPEGNFTLWVKLSKGMRDKIKVTLLFNHLRPGEKEKRLREKNASTRKPDPAAVLKISSGWVWGGGGHSPQSHLLRAGLHRLSPPTTQEEESFGWHNLRSETANTHPPLHKPAQLRNPQPHGPHPQDVHVRSGWGGAIIHQRPPRPLQTHSWGLAPEHCTWFKVMQMLQSMLQETLSNLFPAGKVPGHSHLAWAPIL